MFNEERDKIIVKMITLIEEKLKEKGSTPCDELDFDYLWDDELMSKFDDLFEPHSQGWRNHN